jgi:hypothetical protein
MIVVTARAAIANEEYVIAIYDNAQKGQQLKFQRNGSSNQFWKGTARTLLKIYNPIERGEAVPSAYVIPITHDLDQAIPSPTGMPCLRNGTILLIVSCDSIKLQRKQTLMTCT